MTLRPGVSLGAFERSRRNLPGDSSMAGMPAIRRRGADRGLPRATESQYLHSLGRFALCTCWVQSTAASAVASGGPHCVEIHRSGAARLVPRDALRADRSMSKRVTLRPRAHRWAHVCCALCTSRILQNGLIHAIPRYALVQDCLREGENALGATGVNSSPCAENPIQQYAPCSSPVGRLIAE